MADSVSDIEFANLKSQLGRDPLSQAETISDLRRALWQVGVTAPELKTQTDLEIIDLDKKGGGSSKTLNDKRRTVRGGNTPGNEKKSLADLSVEYFSTPTEHAYVAAVKADAPLFYFPLNESTVAPVDAMGIHTASVVGTGITVVSDGPLGSMSAYRFDGNGNIDIPDHASFDPAAFSYECWVRRTSATGAVRTLMGRGAQTDFGAQFRIATNELSQYTIPNVADIFTATAPTLNAWTHVVLTATANAQTMFVNGVATNHNAAAHPGNSTSPFSLGGYFWINAGSYLNRMVGDLAHCAMYNFRLSQAQVDAHYAARTG